MRQMLEDQLRRQRGNGPTFLESFVAIYVIGMTILNSQYRQKEYLLNDLIIIYSASITCDFSALNSFTGYIFEEVREMWKEGLGRYVRNMWNVIDVCRDTSYVIVMALRIVAYVQQQQEISQNPKAAYIPREEWDAFDPQLIAEGVCAMANIFR